LHWHEFYELALGLFGVGGRQAQVWDYHIFVHYRSEFFGYPLFEVAQRMFAGDCKAHDVGTVPLLVKCKQGLSDAWLRQAL